ncbi:uncharacterized protein LOC131996932 [Stomoxys calcitrans]|uniref:uncharacterized protein LOC131996932 n=1 Tax=Stomoxys calcitrans TaxID=35570 RepID=UPI0027E306C9|nr:uncharacterized protein LOC131996932 [Stomoxys calcitrans]
MKTLPGLGEIRISRWLATSSSMEVELYGFADASEKAFVAVIYIRASNKTTLVAAKSKVNPVKNRKTLPKKSEAVKDKFVRVRVEEIKKAVPSATWGHVRSKENPADAASRGMKPELLKEDDLWWSGPQWLQEKKNWPSSMVQPFIGVIKENKQEDNVIMQLITRVSNYKKIIRIVAYVRRFIERAQRKPKGNELTAEEIDKAERLIITSVQANQFSLEISCLRNGSEIQTRSKICGLNPFIDADEVLRVGGRLENSCLSYNRKHPVLLGKGCLVDRIITGIHKETLHGGAKVMENVLRNKYWVIGAKNAVKKAVRLCVKCAHYRRETAAQLMGNLPVYQKEEDNVLIKDTSLYLSVWQSRQYIWRQSAILQQKHFWQRLDDFSAEEGKVAICIGAARHLDEEFIKAVQQNSDVASTLASELVEWHFIPLGAPHFGGLWEAAAKSVKHHLRRVTGENKFLCRGNWAWEDANDQSCELAALKPTSKCECQFLRTQNRNVWIELLFKTKEQVSVHILCSEHTKGVY